MTEHVRNVSGECEGFLSESQQDTWQIVMEARSCFKQVLKANSFHALLQNQIPLAAMVYEARLQCDAVETSALRPLGALHGTVCERTLSQRMRLPPYHNRRPTLGLVSF